jgi:large subunit ribosomal protein L21e
MAQKTKGSRNKSRKKLSKHIRDKETISNHLKEFDQGEQVRIELDSSIHKGLPHPRFHGKTGRIKEQRGSSYIVEIQDRSKTKEIPVYPAHLQEA